jgi:hypothetical protein
MPDNLDDFSVAELRLMNDQAIIRRNMIPEYVVWKGMLSRCYNPNYHAHHRYGGRGLTVYEPWRKEF